MDKDKWKVYQERSLLYLNKNIYQWLPDANSKVRPSKYRINKKWRIIQYSIEATKTDRAVPLEPYKNRTHYKTDISLPIRQLKNKIITIHDTLLRFSKCKLELVCHTPFNQISQQAWDKYWTIWPSLKWQLYNINKLFNSPIFTNLPSQISQPNFKQIQKIIKEGLYACKELLKEYQLKYDLNNINKYNIQRNDNLILNQQKMINSIMDRKPRTIHLDRLIITDPITQDIQDLESTPCYKSITDIPHPFTEIYRRIPSIAKDTYHLVLVPITTEELKQTISSLSNHKAASISGITYKDIKHLHDNFIDFITNFFNDILISGQLPNSWNNAYIYPIPKPTDWSNNIQYIRPIILLESFQKLFIKIITARLLNILSVTNILQPNNRAGLLGESTYQPLQHFTHAIKMANLKDHKQELWIGLQDLSKAYDRINTSLLKLSLQRIRFPNKITNIILQLFTNRYNQVITPTGYTPQYKVIQEIDLGEVISPLMWIIYYDHLFAYINTSSIPLEDHFTIMVKNKRNIWNATSDLPITYYLSVQGYLNNTTWVAPSFSPFLC
ncbi:hypothetical protein RclHR1_00500003 [Rhizophagus clarus]|uniref:RNA-directed DNA polymerase from mobile element jockey-like n=1 Tax=Rhizophagus clarus TaxID=94130 RepID=A0A2Z6RXL8_9GLOM|nr:hypothetical protein RclHR1_00500003 [Rhizophagus clarus]GES95421.1 RNA-directed DNA polymerase from mobile element jockey-like [Rhizophagus clarus]